MKKLLIIFFAVALLFSLGALVAGACDLASPPPGYFEIVSNDGTRVFRHEIFDWDGETDYIPPASTVYSNTEPRELLYSIELGYIRENQLLFSDDMSYIALSRWSGQNLIFFAEGNRITDYSRNDFIRRHSAMYREPEHACDLPYRHNWNISDFCTETNELTITTTERRTFVIDITTGEIISQSRGVNIVLISATSIVVLAIAFAVAINRKNKSKIEVNHEPTPT